MKKILLLLVSGMLVLSLSGVASATSTVLIPDDFVPVTVGSIEDVELQLTLEGPGPFELTLAASDADIEAWIVDSTNNKVDTGTVTPGFPQTKTFTYDGPIDGTIKVKRISGTETGKVSVSVFSQSTGSTFYDEFETGESVDVPIPEFPTVALPIAAILGLVFIFGRKKEGL